MSEMLTSLNCSAGAAGLSAADVKAFKTQLHTDWKLCASGKTLSRHFSCKGFAKAVSLANLCAWLADKQGHHPDITFGWGYCQVSITTHDVDALSKNDFIWAAKLDNLVQ